MSRCSLPTLPFSSSENALLKESVAKEVQATKKQRLVGSDVRYCLRSDFADGTEQFVERFSPRLWMMSTRSCAYISNATHKLRSVSSLLPLKQRSPSCVNEVHENEAVVRMLTNMLVEQKKSDSIDAASCQTEAQGMEVTKSVVTEDKVKWSLVMVEPLTLDCSSVRDQGIQTEPMFESPPSAVPMETESSTQTGTATTETSVTDNNDKEKVISIVAFDSPRSHAFTCRWKRCRRRWRTWTIVNRS